jgi:hypothetical protein
VPLPPVPKPLFKGDIVLPLQVGLPDSWEINTPNMTIRMATDDHARKLKIIIGCP